MSVIEVSPERLEKLLGVVGRYLGQNRTNESRREISHALREAGFSVQEAARFKGYKAEKLYDLLATKRVTTLDRKEAIALPEANEKKATQVKFKPSQYNYGKPYAAICTYDIHYFTGVEEKTVVITYSKKPTIKQVIADVLNVFEGHFADYGAMPDANSIKIELVKNDKKNKERLKKEAAERSEKRREEKKLKKKGK